MNEHIRSLNCRASGKQHNTVGEHACGLDRRERLAWAVLPAAGAERGMLKIGDPPPPFSLQDTDGRTVTAPGDFAGNTVVVHFWADWCPYCLEEMPVLDKLYRQYKKQGLRVYAVNVGQGLDAARAYVSRVKITYPVLLDTEGKQRGPTASWACRGPFSSTEKATSSTSCSARHPVTRFESLF